MLKVIKYLFILFTIFFIVWYAHIKIPFFNFEFIDYKITVSAGFVLFCLICICFFFTIIYNIFTFFLFFPKKFYDKHHNIRYEHGTIALIEALIGVLSDNLEASKMFYLKARSILGDTAEIIAVKAHIYLMEGRKAKASIEFGRLLNYNDTRLLGIKFFKDNDDHINLDNLVSSANQSLQIIYQPLWFKILMLDLWYKSNDWNSIIKYVDSVGRKYKKILLPYKAYCLYNLAFDIYNNDPIKAKRILEESMLIDSSNVYLILEYSRLLCNLDEFEVCKKFLLQKYKLLKSPLISREIILILQYNDIIDVDKKMIFDKLHKLNTEDPWPLIALIDMLINDRCYSEINCIIESLGKIKSTTLLTKLLSFKLSLLTAGVNSIDLSLKIDIIIDNVKDSLLDNESMLKYNKFNSFFDSKT